MLCRRLGARARWCRRVSLQGANSGKTDCEEQAKESFNHGARVKKARHFRQRISGGLGRQPVRAKVGCVACGYPRSLVLIRPGYQTFHG